MICASIDLGTQTCLLLIAEWDANRKEVKRVISDHSTIVRLGEGVDQNRALSQDAMARTLTCLKNYAEIVSNAGVSSRDTICVATSQARDAKNGYEFFAQVEKDTGFKFRIISGEQEAQFSFYGGLLPGMAPEHSVVIDIGGGSTELVTQNGGKSIDLGSVRFTERYLKSNPVTDNEFWACQEAIDLGLKPLQAWRAQLGSQMQLIAVAGTATTLAAWHLGLEQFNAKAIDGCVLSRGDIHRMVEELKWRSIDERKAISAINPKRADIILAGALILWRSLEVLDFLSCQVSTRGLRYGILRLKT